MNPLTLSPARLTPFLDQLHSRLHGHFLSREDASITKMITDAPLDVCLELAEILESEYKDECTRQKLYASLDEESQFYLEFVRSVYLPATNNNPLNDTIHSLTMDDMTWTD